MKTKSNNYTLILHLEDRINAHLNIINKNFYSNWILVFFGVLFLSVSSYIKIPFYPVPLTMQTLAVLLIAMSYGFSRGTLTVSTYLSLGFVGMPVFASGSGIAYMFGPTGGYLIGFLFATVVIGYLSDRGMSKKWSYTILCMLAGNIIIYIFGLVHLQNLLNINLTRTLEIGLYPFIYGDFLKIILAASLMSGFWKLVNNFTKK